MKIIGVAGPAKVIALNSIQVEIKRRQPVQAMVFAVVELGDILERNVRQVSCDEFTQGGKRRLPARYAERGEVSVDELRRQEHCFLRASNDWVSIQSMST